MNIAVVTSKNIHGGKGGAEIFYAGLIKALNNAGHRATEIPVAVDESSFEGILESYCRCYYLDLDDYDLVISTKAPTYMVRHRNHIVYLLHTIRVFYDRFETEIDGKDPEKQHQRKIIHAFDKYGLDTSRIKKHFAIGRTVVQRLKDADPAWDSIPFEILYPATFDAPFREPRKGEFVFLPGRLHPWKRVDLVIRAMNFVRGETKLRIAGTGEDSERLIRLARELGLQDRVEFLGQVSDNDLLEFYSQASVLPFCPVQEDFGYVAIEAYKTKKPVITCRDSGEPAHIVRDGVSGFVVDPDPEKIAEKINFCIDHPGQAATMGEEGYRSVQDITWDNVVGKLLDAVAIPSRESEDRRIRVLITDMQPIEPAVGGGRLRLKGLYSSLGNDIRAVYAGTYDWKGERKRELTIAKNLVEIDIPLSDEHFRLNEYLNKLISGHVIIDTVFPFLAEASPEFLEKVTSEARTADAIIISHPWLYPTIKTRINRLGKILIYDSHNVEADLRKHLLGDTPFARCIVQLVKFCEQELCEESDLVLACSEEDRAKFIQCYRLDPKKIEIFPNGVDASAIRPADHATKLRLKKKLGLLNQCAVFIGSEYPPNIDAAQYIIRDLADKCPEIQFLIVGGVGGSLDGGTRKNIRIFGRVSDDEKKQILAASDLAINPVEHGSGTNIKMFDFMAAGLPTITTPAGARGIVNRDAFIVVGRPGFPEKIRGVLADPKIYDDLSHNARSLVEECYDWNSISKKLGDRIRNLTRAGDSP